MISSLAEERMKKLRIALDRMDADPEILFYRCRNINKTTVIGIMFGPEITKELIGEMENAIIGIKKAKGWT